MRRKSRLKNAEHAITKMTAQILGPYCIIYTVRCKERYNRKLGYRWSITLEAPKPYPTYRFCVPFPDLNGEVKKMLELIHHELELTQFPGQFTTLMLDGFKRILGVQQNMVGQIGQYNGVKFYAATPPQYVGKPVFGHTNIPIQQKHTGISIGCKKP